MSGKIIKIDIRKNPIDDDDDIEGIWGSDPHAGEQIRCPYCHKRFLRK